MRATLARDPSVPFLVAAEFAAFLLGLASRSAWARTAYILEAGGHGEAEGGYTFLGAEARPALGVSEIAAENAVRRLKTRGRLVAPRPGFFVIVPVEYRAAGAPPPSWFIDDLMRFLGQPYYVGLLSAAALHGASHQQPMVFQVVTDRPTRPAKAGRV